MVLRKRAHMTEASQRLAGVVSSDYWEFQPGQRVRVVEGLLGTVERIEDGPFPGSEEYVVVLDDGMGGGAYSSSELSPAAAVTAVWVDTPESNALFEQASTLAGQGNQAMTWVPEFEGDEPWRISDGDRGPRVTEAAVEGSEHTADQDYPELGTILTDRPPLAHSVTGAKVAFPEMDWLRPNIDWPGELPDFSRLPTSVTEWSNKLIEMAEHHGIPTEHVPGLVLDAVEFGVEHADKLLVHVVPHAPSLLGLIGFGHLSAVIAKDYEGEEGNSQHITRREDGTLPTHLLAKMQGVRGEQPGEHRNRQGAAWDSFLVDIQTNGIKNPIFITVDYGQEPKISEGNHRRDAALDLGLEEVPVEIRYFGHAEKQGSVSQRLAKVAGIMDRILEPWADSTIKKLDPEFRPGAQGDGSMWSFDWCRFRKNRRCMYAKELDAQGTAEAGYSVWLPEDRGLCARDKWEDQKTCPVGEPGPHSKDPNARLDATVPWSQGGQRGGNSRNTAAMSFEAVGNRYFFPGEDEEISKAEMIQMAIEYGLIDGDKLPSKDDKLAIGRLIHRIEIELMHYLTGTGEVQVRWTGFNEPSNTNRVIPEEELQQYRDITAPVSPQVREWIDRHRRGEDAGRFPTAAAKAPFEFFGAWEDVRDKGKRIRASGGVVILSADARYVAGEVKGDGAVYETKLEYAPGSTRAAIAMWDCTCPWSTYSWGRTRSWKKYEGRMCAHALALSWEAQSRGMFGKDVVEDVASFTSMKLVSTDAELHEAPAVLMAAAMLSEGIPFPRVAQTMTEMGASHGLSVVARAMKTKPIKCQVPGKGFTEVVEVDGATDMAKLKSGDEVPADKVLYPTYHPSKGLNFQGALVDDALQMIIDGYARGEVEEDAVSWYAPTDAGQAIALDRIGSEIATVQVSAGVEGDTTAAAARILAYQSFDLAMTYCPRCWKKGEGFTDEEKATFTVLRSDDPDLEGAVEVCAECGKTIVNRTGDRWASVTAGDYDYSGEHVKVWEAENGPVPEGKELHHRNGDKEDNSIGNLECLTPKEHHSRHPRGGARKLPVTSVAGPLYHGTTAAAAAIILAHGFEAAPERGIFLTPHEDLAHSYAEGAVKRAGGGEPAVLRVGTVEGVSGHEVGYMDPILARNAGADFQDKGPEILVLNVTAIKGKIERVATVHDEPEPALPQTDGESDEEDWEFPHGEVPAPGSEKLSWLMSGTNRTAAATATVDSMDIAAAAREALSKMALKTFSPAEQQMIINEGADVQAGNLASLDIAGTHYMQVEEALQDEEDEEVGLWL